MKKFLLTLLTVALAVCSIVFVGAACSDNTETGNDRIYTVTFDSDGGTPVKNQQVAEGKKVNEPDIPVKTGYTFAGWFVKTTEWNFLSHTVTENVTLKAKWIANKYKITFDSDGGTPVENQQVAEGKKVNEPDIPVKTGYTFAGWFVKTTEWNFLAYTVTENVTLKAKWIANKYKITFDSDGGTPISDMEVTYNEAYTLPIPEKEDSVFLGWFLNGVKFESGTPFSSNVTLVARWEAVNKIFIFTENNGEITITKFIGFLADIIIPSKINGTPVTAIGEEVFKDNINITSITIPDSVTSIGSAAFSGCNGLIENKNGIHYVDNWVVGADKDITVANIKSGAKGFGNFAFENCSRMTSVTIPDSVKFIGFYAFGGCSSLTNVTIPDSVISIGDYAFVNCSSITSVIIPDSVKFIGFFVFGGCSSLTNVTIPDSVTSIGDYAFGWCSNLTSINIPDSVTHIGNYSFAYCNNLLNIIVGNSVTYIGENAFTDCDKLVEVINNSSLNITKGSSGYGGIAYYALNVKNGGTSDIVNKNDYLFYTTDNVNYLLGYAGKDKEPTLPLNYNGENYVIHNHAFDGCYSLTGISIPNSVISIGSYAFSGCSNLTSITIPVSITSIGKSAFNACGKLVEVINNSSLNITKGSWENGFIALHALNVKNGGTSDIVSKNGYLFYTADNFNYLLGYVGKDKEANLPLNYNGENYIIHNNAFYGCSSLTNITIPDSVTSIGDYAFYGCSSLTNITIPDSVTSIGDFAFDNCKSLTSVTLGNRVTSIGTCAFSDCISLKNITIGNRVTSIGFNAFYGCSNLKTINYTGTKEQWDAIDKGDNWDYNAGDYTINYNYKEEN